MTHSPDQVVLPADSNQALGIGRFAVEFMSSDPATRGNPAPAVLARTAMFHTDAVLCGASALALGTNAPTVLREEALGYRTHGEAGFGAAGKRLKRHGASVFGSGEHVMPEKAIAANVAAVREWDSNGTNFGYSEHRPEHRAGEFGHNDFYAVPVAAAQMTGKGGAEALLGMVLLDEIRGRLAEVFSLKTYKIDHVVHGAIGSAAVFGAMLGASADQIESAIGMFVAHAVPFRAIRHGHQLSDSKGASAAVSTEFAILSMKRSMAGFVGPKDVFRNPEAIWCLFQKPAKKNTSPFDLVLSRGGPDFTVMGMHFKLGLYEHQSAGALQGLIDLLGEHPSLLSSKSSPGDRIRKMVVKAYEPAFHIIGDPAKRDPHTRQSADHSMLYLVCTMLRKALELQGGERSVGHRLGWKELMLTPHDFTHEAIVHPVTRSLMAKMSFEHGGPEYDRRYPDGIPTSVQITDDAGETYDSGLVMYPSGHARNTTADLADILGHKWRMLAGLASDSGGALVSRLENPGGKTPAEIDSLYNFEIARRGRFE
jgi:2-methylcitrate dehydratase